MLHETAKDMTIFTPHSTRSASASKVATKVPMETVLKTGGCVACERLQMTTDQRGICCPPKIIKNCLVVFDSKKKRGDWGGERTILKPQKLIACQSF